MFRVLYCFSTLNYKVIDITHLTMSRCMYAVWLLYLFFPMLTYGQTCKNGTQNQAQNEKLSEGSLSFAFNLFNKISAANSGNNIIYSPFSVRTVLAMTSTGAAGTTLSQMNSALQLNNFQGENQINQAFQSLLNTICTTPNYTLSTANKIYLENNFPVYKSFVDTLGLYYMSSAENVDFAGKAKVVTQQINDWVAQKTENIIKNLFPEPLSSSTELVLVNAIYFKGNWQTKFLTTNTKSESFTLADGKTTVNVPMMHLTTQFNYADSSELSSQVLEMNYAGNRLVMNIFLPHQGSSLSDVQAKLNSQTFNSFRKSLSQQKVVVTLPKFTINFQRQLNQDLQSLGMVNLFNQQTANLSLIANLSRGNLYVTTVVHQAYVSVDEEGTTAAAATGVGISRALAVAEPPIQIVFLANRPFIFAIVDTDSDQILFMGNVNDPSKK